jgi:nifR3 family TIM-barrel protein
MNNMHGFWGKLKKPFFILAPMADVTDVAFRGIIAKYGKPDVLFTEFVSSDGLFRGGYDALINDLSFSEEERPIVAQFFSKNIELMQKSAELAVSMGFDGIDINMGCPDKNVCKQGAGAGMIKTPALAEDIIRATAISAGAIPVSVKTRIGFNTNEIETWLPALLSANPAVITLHARTKKQKSKVPADWSQIKRAVAIRDALGSTTLIVGNGDAEDLATARERVKETGCDGVMIGRGIFGNPWLFSEKIPTTREKLEVMIEHTKLFDELLGSVKNFSIMRKHYKAYVQGFVGAKELRMELMESTSAEDAIKITEEFLKSGKI